MRSGMRFNIRATLTHAADEKLRAMPGAFVSHMSSFSIAELEINAAANHVKIRPAVGGRERTRIIQQR
jgi:hypothetical protein